MVSFFSSRPNKLELESSKNCLALKMDTAFLLPNHKSPMATVLIYHYTKLLDFTSNTHSIYITKAHTLINKKQKQSEMQNAWSSTYLSMGYWPIHHGEPDLATW
jgi:hypothetical protein